MYFLENSLRYLFIFSYNELWVLQFKKIILIAYNRENINKLLEIKLFSYIKIYKLFSGYIITILIYII